MLTAGRGRVGGEVPGAAGLPTSAECPRSQGIALARPGDGAAVKHETYGALCRESSLKVLTEVQRSELLVVLLHAIEKDTGEVPRSDIALAKRRMTDFKRRMDAERRQPPRAGSDWSTARRASSTMPTGYAGMPRTSFAGASARRTEPMHQILMTLHNPPRPRRDSVEHERRHRGVLEVCGLTAEDLASAWSLVPFTTMCGRRSRRRSTMFSPATSFSS
jgi:hypothetical protein